MKKFVLLLLSALLLLPVRAEERKKVAVVLSGGGAKGVAHIRALKVIEDAGIPIDYVVGTSMGAIVGGLYSIGFSTEQLDTLVQNLDWRQLLSDATERKDLSLAYRQRAEQYIVSVPFDKQPKEVLTGGVIKGRNIAILFSQLTEGYHDSIDFNTLPIPFACVAYNLVDGTEVDFHSGVLAEAIRASMSIPGAFTPVRKGEKMLVDGGMANNYPVDVARRMGADYIIGVDVQDTLRSADKLTTLPNVVGQIVNLMVENKYKENVRESDVHIKVNVGGYSSTSFTRPAIDSLLARGEKAAMLQWDNLLVLKQKTLGLPSDYRPPIRPGCFVSMSDSVPLIKSITPEEKPDNRLRLGVRFDSEKLASLILNAHLSLTDERRSLVDFTLRLGRTGYGEIDYAFHVDREKRWQSLLSYQFGYNDVDLYNRGERVSNYTFYRHLARAAFQRSWHDIRCVLGIGFNQYHYNDILVLPEYASFGVSPEDEYFFSYSYNMYFENFNKRSYPTQGMKWTAGINVYTSDFWRYHERPAIPVVNFSWEMALSTGSRFTVLPSVYGRFVWKRDVPYALHNSIGGLEGGRYKEQQLPFIGVSYMELANPMTAVAALKLRQRMGSNHYATFTSNFALSSLKIKNLLKEDKIFGCGFTYGYESVIGPLEASAYWSDRTDKLGFLISFGYNF